MRCCGGAAACSALPSPTCLRAAGPLPRCACRRDRLDHCVHRCPSWRETLLTARGHVPWLNGLRTAFVCTNAAAEGLSMSRCLSVVRSRCLARTGTRAEWWLQRNCRDPFNGSYSPMRHRCRACFPFSLVQCFAPRPCHAANDNHFVSFPQMVPRPFVFLHLHLWLEPRPSARSAGRCGQNAHSAAAC